MHAYPHARGSSFGLCVWRYGRGALALVHLDISTHVRLGPLGNASRPEAAIALSQDKLSQYASIICGPRPGTHRDRYLWGIGGDDLEKCLGPRHGQAKNAGWDFFLNFFFEFSSFGASNSLAFSHGATAASSGPIAPVGRGRPQAAAWPVGFWRDRDGGE